MESKILRSRLILLGVALVFIIPILVSWYLVFFSDFKKGDGGTQKGELISPVIPLGEPEVFNLKSKTIESINGKWTLLFFVENECNQLCEDKLYQLRQIRLALGKDRDKVDRLLVSKNKQQWSQYTNSFNGQKYIDPTSRDYNRLIKKLNDYAGLDLKATYLIDPYGFLMMKYPQDDNPMGTIKDIERLIKNQK
jgi:cytochrome oxidase Cu insertion factor (SCO1/SenC/PrrC family)|tara:strand:+ start:3209 stop:3790 length:582 start_codon:yes stop_codon:yes gene_type:complete